MPTVTASTRRKAAEATLELPFRVPPQEWFTLRGAGAVLGLAESTVEKLYDKGEFAGHAHNAGKGHRNHKRITRASLIAYLLRTADYTDQTFADLYCSPLSHFPKAALLQIAQTATRLAAK